MNFKRTKFGFGSELLRAEAVCDNVIRVINLRTGDWVSMQVGAAGAKSYTASGKFTKEETELIRSEND